MRTFWQEAPFVRIAVAVIVGVGSYILFEHVIGLAWLGLFLSIGVGIISLSVVYYVANTTIVKSYKYRFLNGAALLMLLVAVGYILAWFNASIYSKNHFSKLVGNSSCLVGVLTEPPSAKEKVVVAVIHVDEIANKTGLVSSHGKLLVNFQRDEESERLKYGDRIVFRNNFQLLTEPKNPNEFSYKLYQSFHAVYHRAFLKRKDWRVAGDNQGNFILRNVYALRFKFLHVI